VPKSCFSMIAVAFSKALVETKAYVQAKQIARDKRLLIRRPN
jgi:hypothetical protein